MEEDVPIEHGVISKSIENAQIKVEGHNFDLRKHVVQYDDVMNKHREVIYADRRQLVMGEDVQDRVWEMVEGEIEKIVDANIGDGRDTGALRRPHPRGLRRARADDEVTLDEIAALETRRPGRDADRRRGPRLRPRSRRGSAPEVMRKVERHVMLTIIDKLWVEHLTAMDELREGVGLQAYAPEGSAGRLQDRRGTSTSSSSWRASSTTWCTRSSGCSRSWRSSRCGRGSPTNQTRLRCKATAAATAPRRASRARSASTSPAPAAAARSTSTATARPTKRAGVNDGYGSR